MIRIFHTLLRICIESGSSDIRSFRTNDSPRNVNIFESPVEDSKIVLTRILDRWKPYDIKKVRP